MRVQQASSSFALCVEDGGMEDLEARKLYQILPDREAAREGYIRVPMKEPTVRRFAKRVPHQIGPSGDYGSQ
jgi:hypothetical protein